MAVIQTHGDIRSYFHERVQASLKRFSVSVTSDTERYLVDLLAERQCLATPDAPLVQQWAQALEEEDPREKLRRFQTAGDAALYTCGFFANHVQQRGMSADYFVSMGGRCYRSASELSLARRHTFEELAGGFRRLVDVLEEVRESTVLRTPQDIVKLYDTWRRTKSPRVAARLHSAGVFPTVPKPDEEIH